MKRKSGEPSFASRWSRLKQDAKAAPEEAEAAADAPTGAETEPSEDRPDEEVLADLGLPDPDTLKPGDDFKAFMAKAVPARIRVRALRKLWISDPVLANIDGLVDYGEDFTDAATVIENLQTAYQVGRGWADKAAEVSGKDAEDGGKPAVKPAAAGAQQEPAPAAEGQGGETAGHEGPVDAASAGESSADAAAGGDSSGRTEEIVQSRTAEFAISERRILTRRRMHFRVSEE